MHKDLRGHGAVRVVRHDQARSPLEAPAEAARKDQPRARPRVLPRVHRRVRHHVREVLEGVLAIEVGIPWRWVHKLALLNARPRLG